MTVAALCHLAGVSGPELKKKVDSWGIPVEVNLKEERRGEFSGLYLQIKIHDRLPEVFFTDIQDILGGISEKKEVKEKTLEAFQTLFKAEAEAHGLDWRRVHLHEAGAWDAIFDLLATSWLLDEISPSEVLHGPVNLGAGQIPSSHGLLPVPAPAVVALLRGREVFSSGPSSELTTPTGATILKTFALPSRLPPGRLSKEGRGLGTRSFPGFPNYLRVLSIEEGPSQRAVYELEFQVDDAPGELLGGLWELLEGKALDMVMVPVYMKKGRPGVLLRILTGAENLREVQKLVFENTTTIGLRFSLKERVALERERLEVAVDGEKAFLKVSYLEGRPVNVAPEFSSCRELAERLKISIKEACRRILAQWREK